MNRNVFITLPPKYTPLKSGSSSRCFLTSSLEVRVEVSAKSSAEAQGWRAFVINVGRRVGSGFCSGYLEEKAKKRKKKEETRV